MNIKDIIIPILTLILNVNHILSHHDDDWMLLNDNDESEELCLVKSETNLYGKLTDYTKTIKYYYGMKYDGLQGNIKELVHDIELTITNTLLVSTHLFPECYVEYNDFEKERNKHPSIRRSNRGLYSSSKNRRRIENQDIVGISTSPEDMYTKQKCSNEVSDDSTSTCVEVEGQMNLFLDNNNATISEEDLNDIQLLIEYLMTDDGRLESSYSYIHNLEYHGSAYNGASRRIHGRNTFISVFSVSLAVLGIGSYKWRQNLRFKNAS